VRAHLEEVGRDWHWSAHDEVTRIESTHPDFEPLEVELNLLGKHQRDNAATAVAALYGISGRFPVRHEAIREALRKVDWPGRLQLLSRNPLVLVDGAHNGASAQVLRDAVDSTFDFERLHLVIGLTEGKDALGVLTALAPRADAVYLTRSRHERSAPASELEPIVRAAAPSADIHVLPEAGAAFESALNNASARDLVLITGSLFLIGEALVWWRRLPR
jgi:dihydrofolate synthase / folylpolyglutamate synthase